MNLKRFMVPLFTLGLVERKARGWMMNGRITNKIVVFIISAISLAACGGSTPDPLPVADAPCAEPMIVSSPLGYRVLDEIPQLGKYVVCADGAGGFVLDALGALGLAESDQERQWLPDDEVGDSIGAQADEWRQWHLDKMQAEEAWLTSTGEGVTVYVLDTAGDCGSMDMNCGEGRNYVGGSSRDGHGHGSHVGSTIGELLNNRRGVGVAHDVTVAFYKVLGDSGSGSVSGIARAMTDAADVCPGKCIISMSLGSLSPSTTLNQAAEYAIGKGVPVIAAAGNHGDTRPSYPGCSPGVIGIGATDINDRIASFSGRGGCVDLAGPGVNITASRPDGSPWTISGTSMATPNVSAVAALALSLGADPADIERLLESTADDIGGQQLGAGRANALRIVQAVGSPGPRPTDDTPLPTNPAPRPTVDPGPAPTSPSPVEPFCEGRALLFDGGAFKIGPVLVPCDSDGS